MSSSPVKSTKRTRVERRGRADVPMSSPGALPPSSPTMGDLSDFDEGFTDPDAVNDIEDEDEDGEDLFADDAIERDYGEDIDPRLDAYDAEDINDEEEFEEMGLAERRAAEREMDRRDRGVRRGARAARRQRVPGFMLSEDDMDDDDDPHGGLLSGLKPRARRQYDERKALDDADGLADGILSIEEVADVKADSIAEWIATDLVGRSIKFYFKDFLLSYTDEQKKSKYGHKIQHLGEVNGESLEVSFIDLSDYVPFIAFFVSACPSGMLDLMSEVVMDCVLIVFPEYFNIHEEVHARITDLPTSLSLRDLRRQHLNTLVRVTGVVTRRSGVFPQLKYVKFDCKKCGATLGPFYQDTNKEVKINYCPNCESRGPFEVNSDNTVYRNYQRMTLQESPGSVPAGRLPRHREVILLWDLIDSAKPGDEIEVTGVYLNNFDAALNTKNGFPVFSTVIEANHINKKEDLFAAMRLTEEDERKIREMARDERIGKRIAKSIAPSIYGHENIKTAIALSLFGGVPKNVNNKLSIRGDINVLLLGDPGTAKSQFLKYVEKTAHRAVFATGQGASAVGLTASVRKDPVTREWTLEGGALVLADKGVCLIDEFDKMNDQDRTSIHEAMEQQTISISKAGIVTTLQARCAVIAAANPIRGRYNPTVPFSQNVELTEPILSRFDVLCVVKDTVDPVADELLARFVVSSHARSHPKFDHSNLEHEMAVQTSLDADIISQDFLRKYIMYARDRVHPKLHNLDTEKLSSLFADLRRESRATGSVPITVRHLESVMRMAEASAKMHLREYVRGDDIDLAISVAIGSFVSAQKMSVKKTLERGFRKYMTFARDHEELLAFILGQMIKERVRTYQAYHYEQPNHVTVKVADLDIRAKEHDIFDTTPFLKSRLFTANGYTLENGVIKKVFNKSD